MHGRGGDAELRHHAGSLGDRLEESEVLEHRMVGGEADRAVDVQAERIAVCTPWNCDAVVELDDVDAVQVSRRPEGEAVERCPRSVRGLCSRKPLPLPRAGQKEGERAFIRRGRHPVSGNVSVPVDPAQKDEYAFQLRLAWLVVAVLTLPEIILRGFLGMETEWMLLSADRAPGRPARGWRVLRAPRGPPRILHRAARRVRGRGFDLRDVHRAVLGVSRRDRR